MARTKGITSVTKKAKRAVHRVTAEALDALSSSADEGVSVAEGRMHAIAAEVAAAALSRIASTPPPMPEAAERLWLAARTFIERHDAFRAAVASVHWERERARDEAYAALIEAATFYEDRRDTGGTGAATGALTVAPTLYRSTLSSALPDIGGLVAEARGVMRECQSMIAGHLTQMAEQRKTTGRHDMGSGTDWALEALLSHLGAFVEAEEIARSAPESDYKGAKAVRDNMYRNVRDAYKDYQRLRHTHTVTPAAEPMMYRVTEDAEKGL